MSSLEDNEKKIDHKPNDEIDNLMMEEDRNRGSITSETYAKYFKFNGGFSFFGLVFLVQTIWMISRVGSTIWIADWTEKSEKNSESINNTYYLIIYSVFSLVFGLMAFIRALMFVINCTNSANLIHYQMIQLHFILELNF
jgi:hypothetical protein